MLSRYQRAENEKENEHEKENEKESSEAWRTVCEKGKGFFMFHVSFFSWLIIIIPFLLLAPLAAAAAGRHVRGDGGESIC